MPTFKVCNASFWMSKNISFAIFFLGFVVNTRIFAEKQKKFS